MKAAAVFLLLFNFWATLFCCCLEQACPAMAETTTTAQTPSHCASSKTQKTQSCHQTSQSDHEETATPEASASFSLANACDCGNHGMAENLFSKPEIEKRTLAAPVLLALSLWLVSEREEVNQVAFSQAVDAPIVGDHLSPRLSVLSRFLI